MEKSIQGKVSSILFKIDPMSLNFVDNTDEYSSEAKIIVEQSNSVRNVEELEKIIYQIFVMMFNEWLVKRSKADWKKIAEEIWNVIHEIP